jgi:hypothetical protein
MHLLASDDWTPIEKTGYVAILFGTNLANCRAQRGALAHTQRGPTPFDPMTPND